MPGGQAEYLRAPQAHDDPIKVPDGAPDEQFLFRSDVAPTPGQVVRQADAPGGGTLAVLGPGSIEQMSTRIGQPLGTERLRRADRRPRSRGSLHGGQELRIEIPAELTRPGRAAG